MHRPCPVVCFVEAEQLTGRKRRRFRALQRSVQDQVAPGGPGSRGPRGRVDTLGKDTSEVDQPSKGSDMAEHTRGQPQEGAGSERFGPKIPLKPADLPTADHHLNRDPTPDDAQAGQPEAATGPECWATITDPAELASALSAVKREAHRQERVIARLTTELDAARGGAGRLEDGEVRQLASDLEAARSALAETRVDEAVLTRLVATASETAPPPIAIGTVPAEAPTAVARRVSDGLVNALLLLLVTLVILVLTLSIVGISILLEFEPRDILASPTNLPGNAIAQL